MPIRQTSPFRRQGRSKGLLVSLFLAAALPLIFSLLLLPDRSGAASVAKLTASVKQCPGQNIRSGQPNRQAKAMRCLINYARARSGLKRLKKSAQLNRSAKNKSRDIMRCGAFDHNACGRDFTFWMKRVGYARRCWAGAENIAWGQYRLGSPRKIFVAWLRSPGHRANMLSRGFNAFGVGLRSGKFQGHRGARVWTTHFGRRC